jgi:bifunctional enzyme CysN/CysC/sulfate adenylyltransferase subunit 1
VNTFATYPAEHLEMNGIALVEIETSSPLFFDPYERSRVTGSFILIDPLSNATVGAGMIRKALATNRSTGGSSELWPSGAGNSVVNAQARFERHGHRPGIFLLRAGLVQAAEHALFESGFESAALQVNEFAPPALAKIVDVLWSLGTVILLAGDGISAEMRSALESVAAGSLFDYCATGPEPDSEDFVSEILLQAQSLRTDSNRRDAEKEY